MTAIHDQVVQQYRSGKAVDAIAASVGYTTRAIRRILQKKDTPVPRFPGRSASIIRKPVASFQSRPDGEYAQCKRCEHLGYGVDSWYPATTEFWNVEYGRIRYDRCRACISEMKVNAHGVVPGRVAA